MKFNANPDKFLFSIGVIAFGFILIFSYMIAYNNYFMLIPALFWLFLSFLIVRKTYIVVYISTDSFSFKYKGKNFSILFSEVKFIKEISNYSNPLYCNKFYIVSNNDTSSNIQIQNRTFSKWVEEHRTKFKFMKSCTID